VAALTYEQLAQIVSRWRAGETDLDTEAANFSLPVLRDTLAQTRSYLQQVPETWSQQELTTRPQVQPTGDGGEDKWSATEILTHLIATQNWYMLHIGRLLGRRERFEVMPRGLGDYATNELDAATLGASLQQATVTVLAYVASIPDNADLTTQRDSTFLDAQHSRLDASGLRP